MIINLQFSWT